MGTVHEIMNKRLDVLALSERSGEDRANYLWKRGSFKIRSEGK